MHPWADADVPACMPIICCQGPLIFGWRRTFRASEPARITEFPGSALFETRNRVPRLHSQVGPVSPERPQAAQAEAQLLSAGAVARAHSTTLRSKAARAGCPRSVARILPSIEVPRGASRIPGAIDVPGSGLVSASNDRRCPSPILPQLSPK